MMNGNPVIPNQTENNNPLQVDVQLTENDYRSFNLLHQRKMLRTGFAVYWLLFFLIVVGINDFQFDDPLLVAIGLAGGFAMGLIVTGLKYGMITC
jgi:hypothetical protein